MGERRAGWEINNGDRGKTYVIEIDIDATVVEHEEISQGVYSLHWEAVAVIRVEEPGILGRDEVSRGLLGPELDCHGKY